MSTSKIKIWRERANALVAERSAAHTHLIRCRQAVVSGEEEFDAADEAQQITQAIAETIQEEAHNRIAGVVSRCLSIVFDEPYEFHIRFEQARGRTEARLVFVREGQEISPMDASGGGVIDVAAFALRLSCLMLARPAVRRAVVLDEPFKFVSAQLRGRVRQMIEDLAKELDIQFVMITHIEELVTGSVVRIEP